MAILTIVVSITAPALANFFRGRSLDSEARRLLSLTREGQSRAVSEGIPIELWVDAQQGKVGLEAEPGYEKTDAKAVDFSVENDIQIQVVNSGTSGGSSVFGSSGINASASTKPVVSNHPNLPRIRFLPDGTLDESSPQMFKFTGRDGISLWVAQSRGRLSYEIRNHGS